MIGDVDRRLTNFGREQKVEATNDRKRKEKAEAIKKRSQEGWGGLPYIKGALDRLGGGEGRARSRRAS